MNRYLRILPAVSRRVGVLGAILIFLSYATVLRAQTIEVKILNGRNGRPMASKCMDVWVGADKSDERSGLPLQTQTDTNGVIRLRLTADASDTTIVENQRLACGLLGVINPRMKYSDTIGVRAGYVLCHPHGSDYSWLEMMYFSTKEVLQQGVVTENTCGKARALPKPGELIIFVRPLTWWEKLKS